MYPCQCDTRSFSLQFTSWFQTSSKMAMLWIILSLFVWIQSVTGTPTNIALNKPASISSTYGGNEMAPGGAVDGNITTTYATGIIHTAAGQNSSWWTVDLQTQVQDATVKIYFMTDPQSRHRRYGVQLYTSTTPFSTYPSGQLCHTFNGSSIPDVGSANCTGTWRYLMVYTQTNQDGQGAILHFGEVEVLACLSGSYGSGCNLSCEDRNCRLSSICNHVTGQCVGGCLSGWTGIDCKQACPSGSYGSGCNLSCGDRNCRNSSPCDHVTGQCVDGCLSGWNGTDCKQECTQGTNYGANCSNSCSARQCRTLPTTCDPETGQCHNGCQDGWTGEDCTNACPSGTYGPGCGSVCSNCAGDDICNHTNGNCPGDCKAGWQGVQCTNCVSTRADPVVAGVIGAVIAAVLMVVLCGGILLCLVRYGRLKWVKVPDHQKQSTEMGDITSAQVTRQTVSERSNSDPAHSDYAVLDVQTVSNNKDYDVIKNRVYENT